MSHLEELIKDKYARQILNNLLKNENFSIEEELESRTFLRYSKAEQAFGIRTEVFQEKIRLLTDFTILQKTEVKRIVCCPKCNSINMLPSFKCPICSSQHINRRELLEHMKCGYIGPEEEFSRNETIKCPKCGREVTQIGVDYLRVGSMYICSCGQKFSTPREMWTCNECGLDISPGQLSSRPLYRYNISEEKKTELRRLVFDLNPLIEYFSEKHFEMTSPALVVGLSGAEHRYDILGIEASEKKSIVLKLCSNENEVDFLQIMALYTETMDSVITRKGLKRPDHVITICLPKIDQNARKQAERLDITCIDALDSDEAVEKLEKSLWQNRVMKYKSILF